MKGKQTYKKENDEELKYLLALWHISRPSLHQVEVLRKFFSNWQELFAASTSALNNLGLIESWVIGIRNPPWGAVENDLAWLGRNSQHHIITWENELYPALLREIVNPPLILFVHGEVDVLSTPQLAMVGSRNPSYTGLETARNFATEFAISGLTITSGLALGIDAICHKGALDVNGKTIAVMGTGIDNVYPLRNTALAEKIIESNGALISEFPIGTRPNRANFPKRNRIISGLSLGTLVLEATQRSGSLITARFAAEQGREVFAIPGSIHNPLARGCHMILRQGAKLVELAADVLEELGPLAATLKSHRETPYNAKNTNVCRKNPLDPNNKKLLECIGDEITSVDMLIARSGFSASKISSMLINLELNGLIRSVFGGYVKCSKLIS